MKKFCIVLYWFCFGHSISDLALQTKAIATYKSYLYIHSHTYLHPATWFFYLSGHALINGGVSGLIAYFFTRNVKFATIISIYAFSLHWIIDFCSTFRFYSLVVDQFFHLTTLIIYTLLVLIQMKSVKEKS